RAEDRGRARRHRASRRLRPGGAHLRRSLLRIRADSLVRRLGRHHVHGASPRGPGSPEGAARVRGPVAPPFVVFDLDGTLIDGSDAIGDALGYAMERLGQRPPGADKIRAMVGHGLERLLEDAVGAARAAEGVRLFRELYPHVAVEKSHLLPGVPEV